MEVMLLKSLKGQDKIFCNGYGYNFRFKSKKDIFNWACEKRKVSLCKSVVGTKLINGKHIIYKEPTDRNHDSGVEQKEMCIARNKLKKLVNDSCLKPSQIIRKVKVETDSTSRVFLPTKVAQNKIISRKRVRDDAFAEPSDINEINIPQNLKYVDGELFVLSEKRFNNSIIILLGTRSSLKTLGEAKCWLMDGTFYVVPSIMRQLFTIHASIKGHVLPLIFCLMSEKSVVAYEEIFYELCRVAVEEEIDLKPERIITDFELFISVAAKQFFPEAKFKGCLFHFGQIIWRRIQNEGLKVRDGVDVEFCTLVRMLKSLAFVPPEEVGEYFNDLEKYSNDKDFKKILVW